MHFVLRLTPFQFAMFICWWQQQPPYHALMQESVGYAFRIDQFTFFFLFIRISWTSTRLILYFGQQWKSHIRFSENMRQWQSIDLHGDQWARDGRCITECISWFHFLRSLDWPTREKNIDKSEMILKRAVEVVDTFTTQSIQLIRSDGQMPFYHCTTTRTQFQSIIQQYFSQSKFNAIFISLSMTPRTEGKNIRFFRYLYFFVLNKCKQCWVSLFFNFLIFQEISWNELKCNKNCCYSNCR